MSKRRPNILLITSDQQHWNTLGCIGSPVQTPNLDRLAAEGRLFDRAYCPNPTCTPTRSSIITGLYPSQHGAYTLGTKLQEDVPTVGEDLRAAGYRSALVGKAHFQPLKGDAEFPSQEAYPILQDLEYWRDFHGPFYGFDHVELARNHADEAHVGQHYALWMEEKGCSNWRDYFKLPTGTRESTSRHWEIPEDLHYNTWIAERSEALLEQYAAADQSFVLWSSFFDPHPSYLVPEPWASMYDPAEIDVPQAVPGEHDHTPPWHQLTQRRDADFAFLREEGGAGCHGYHSHVHDRDELAKDIAIYYGMVSCMDAAIGRILDKLEALGLAEDTIVVFTSDHGHFYGHHGLIAKGGFHYEDVIKVPFIVRWPGEVEAGSRSSEIQSLVDLAPSFLSAIGAEVPRGMTGLDQTGCWRGAGTARDHCLVEFHHQPTTLQLVTYVDERYKLTCYRGHDFGELWDLEVDPDEVHNRWDDPEWVSETVTLPDGREVLAHKRRGVRVQTQLHKLIWDPMARGV